MTPEKRALLRELLAAATPGPWTVYLNARPGHDGGPRMYGVGATIDTEARAWPDGCPISHFVVEGGSDDYGYAVGVLRNEDARLIVALRNAAPDLLDALDAAEAALEAERARAERAETACLRLRDALDDLLVVAQKERWGIPVDSEEWYLVRDQANLALRNSAAREEVES